MKGKVGEFVSSFAIYCIISLAWNGWHLTTKELAEMIFIGTLGGVVMAFTMKPMTRLVTRIVKKILT